MLLGPHTQTAHGLGKPGEGRRKSDNIKDQGTETIGARDLRPNTNPDQGPETRDQELKTRDQKQGPSHFFFYHTQLIYFLDKFTKY